MDMHEKLKAEIPPKPVEEEMGLNIFREVEVTKKMCTRCNTEKDIKQFRKQKNTKDGLRYYCKACQDALQNKYYNGRKEYYKQKAYESRKRKEVKTAQNTLKEVKIVEEVVPKMPENEPKNP